MMGQRNLARAWPRAAADQRHPAGGVMGTPERPLAPARRIQRLTTDRTDCGSLQRLVLRHLRQDARQA